MTAPNAYEQLMLEMINRGRADPLADAARYGIDLNEGLAPGTISSAAKQPLALNEFLIDSARAHSQWMIAADVFSHNGSGGSSPRDRMEAAGYVLTGPLRGVAENIAWNGVWGAPLDHEAAVETVYRGLFLSESHRVNTFNDLYREIGVGEHLGDFTRATDGRVFDAYMVTQNYGLSGTELFLTGVVIDDQDNDDFYDIGEGLGNVTVTAQGAAGTFTTQTYGSGGYQIALEPGSYTVTFSGGGLGAAVTASVTIGSINVKLDAEKPAAPLLGTAGDNSFAVADGSARVDGGAGFDTVTFSVARAEVTTLDANFANVEQFVFTDGVLRTDDDGIAGQAYRIYQAAFAREPDTPGLKFWTGVMDDGFTLDQAANSFLISDEFQSLYGSAVAPRAYVDLLYQNVLQRLPDEAGYDFWTGHMEAGTIDRAEALVFFSESDENKALVADAIADGIWLG